MEEDVRDLAGKQPTPAPDTVWHAPDPELDEGFEHLWKSLRVSTRKRIFAAIGFLALGAAVGVGGTALVNHVRHRNIAQKLRDEHGDIQGKIAVLNADVAAGGVPLNQHFDRITALEADLSNLNARYRLLLPGDELIAQSIVTRKCIDDARPRQQH